jgi:hypothetical protein
MGIRRGLAGNCSAGFYAPQNCKLEARRPSGVSKCGFWNEDSNLSVQQSKMSFFEGVM